MNQRAYYAKQPHQAAPPQGGQPAGGRVVGYGMGDAGAYQVRPGMPQQLPADAYAQHAAGQSGYAYVTQPGIPYAQAYVPPATSVAVQAPKRKRTGLKVAIVIVVLCLIAAGVIVYFMVGGSGKTARSGAPGQLEGKSPSEIQAELDRIVEEGMFNISIASVVQVPSGDAPADLRIENVPGNRYLMRVSIALDDTGQVIYQTDAIEPNFHIQQDTLDVDLDAGMYDATATFTALDPETEEEVGTAAAKVLIQVQS